MPCVFSSSGDYGFYSGQLGVTISEVVIQMPFVLKNVMVIRTVLAESET